jgi:hypothetical protein
VLLRRRHEPGGHLPAAADEATSSDGTDVPGPTQVADATHQST